MSLTKNPQPTTKNFFTLQTTRLAKSFEHLNSSLPLSEPQLHSRKATCDPAVLGQNAWNRPDAKMLKI